MAEAKSV